MGVVVGIDYRELCVCVSALQLDLKILSGKCGRSESAASGFFVQLCLKLVCNEDACLCWKRFKGIFSDREL